MNYPISERVLPDEDQILLDQMTVSIQKRGYASAAVCEINLTSDGKSCCKPRVANWIELSTMNYDTRLPNATFLVSRVARWFCQRGKVTAINTYSHRQHVYCCDARASRKSRISIRFEEQVNAIEFLPRPP